MHAKLLHFAQSHSTKRFLVTTFFLCDILTSKGNHYRLQTKFAKVMFLHVCVCPWEGMHGRGCAWQGACMVGECAWWGSMCGRRACMTGGVHGGGHVWQRGSMHGRGVFVAVGCVAGEGMCDRGCAWWGRCMAGGMHGGGMCGRGACMPWQIPRDTVNERAVCILLECILVFLNQLTGTELKYLYRLGSWTQI